MKIQTIISTKTQAPANYLARIDALRTDRDSARSELDRALLALHRWQNRLNALASEVEKLDTEITIETADLAFQLRQERDAKYPPLQPAGAYQFQRYRNFVTRTAIKTVSCAGLMKLERDAE